MTFSDELRSHPRAGVERAIMSRSPDDVERALAAATLTPDGLMALLSPAAEPFLEELAQRAHRLTEQRFGKVMSLFAPLYLSNVCTNACRYCGFSVHNPVRRRTLTAEEAAVEGRHLHELGFRHLLLVSGEAPQAVALPYLLAVLKGLRPLFASISIELYPMPTADYRVLVERGVDGLVVFQETYDEGRYREVHPEGTRKRDYSWRLGTPERGGEAGFRRIGIGALLGLSDWRVEGFHLALHATFLMRRFWKSQLTLSFPRLRPAAGGFQPAFPVSDAHLVQLLTAARLFLPDAGFVLSTRESPALRDRLLPLGITSVSAGSSTAPGGYALDCEAEPQFEVADERPPQLIAAVLREQGFEPVWKDWDPAFTPGGGGPWS